MLSSLINSDGIIHIGVYFFKLDFLNQKVFVCHENNFLNSKSKLITNDANGIEIFEFSTDDEIIEILLSNNKPINEVFDGESTTENFRI